MNPKVLIHPDSFYSGDSGAIAAREAARHLSGLGCEVGIFTHDDQDVSIATYPHYSRVPYTGIANFFTKKYYRSFIQVLEDFKPNYVFFIGSFVNTPVVYIDLCIRYKIKTVFLFLMQDFFCARLHAGLGFNSCSKCLDGTNVNSFVNKCGEKQRNPNLYLINYQINQNLIQARMRKINFVLGSSDEQLDFYKRVGVKVDNIVKIPLFFDRNRIEEIHVATESYFVIVGQFRHEKGIHLISKILDNIDDDIKVKLLLLNEEEEVRFLMKYPENRKHIEKNKLEILPGVTMTTGAVQLISASMGVINPSIWSTTTEFVLLEALGMSKPIINFNVGIHKEIFHNRVNGIIVKAGDFKTMGTEINNLKVDRELQKTICLNAKKLFDNLTEDKVYEAVLKRIFK